MITKYLLKGLVAASAFVLCATHAQATTFTENLTGTVANSQFFSFDIGATHYDQWFLSLDGLSGLNAITVSQGDTINATVTLDTPFTIPASQQLTNVGVFLFGSAFPSINTGVNGTTTFYLGGVGGTQVAGGPPPSTTTTSSQLANTIDFFPPNNTAITFDTITSDFTITDLSQPATLDGSGVSYTLFKSAVPEPATWVAMVVGFGALGAAVRRSRRRAAVVA